MGERVLRHSMSGAFNVTAGVSLPAWVHNEITLVPCRVCPLLSVQDMQQRGTWGHIINNGGCICMMCHMDQVLHCITTQSSHGWDLHLFDCPCLLHSQSLRSQATDRSRGEVPLLLSTSFQ
jgi:hypothetical protein